MSPVFCKIAWDVRAHQELQPSRVASPLQGFFYLETGEHNLSLLVFTFWICATAHTYG